MSHRDRRAGPEVALETLTTAVEQAGVDALIVHARKAWLQGLSPRENRDVPPLDYDRVYRLKLAHPRLPVIINGGITNIDQALGHLGRVDGVMMGRAAYRSHGSFSRSTRCCSASPRAWRRRRPPLRLLSPM